MSTTLGKHQLTEQTVTDLCQDEETVHAEQEVNLQVDKNIQIHELLLLLHPFDGLFSRTTWVSRHQKDKPFWILMEQEMMGWQWHQLDHMQITCTLIQTDNHASTSPLSFYRPDALPATQPTASKH